MKRNWVEVSMLFGIVCLALLIGYGLGASTSKQDLIEERLRFAKEHLQHEMSALERVNLWMTKYEALQDSYLRDLDSHMKFLKQDNAWLRKHDEQDALLYGNGLSYGTRDRLSGDLIISTQGSTGQTDVSPLTDLGPLNIEGDVGIPMRTNVGRLYEASVTEERCTLHNHRITP